MRYSRSCCFDDIGSNVENSQAPTQAKNQLSKASTTKRENSSMICSLLAIVRICSSDCDYNTCILKFKGCTI
ncbi:hypothetical protein LXL04_017757 [Taraxacum kok-saghyz]